ncbi:hypothetical protein [Muriicola soli]|uniref:STAS/SEC14 domain-containing protein n=1 Tax=Muriicola soli TaxID=2507538 RepID=A0A411E6R6_9FLAO|nr:hypothetical protein [Muriicola soli]QBA63391.1 hypothetical protein EQY75_01790 [Muriicola soli]
MPFHTYWEKEGIKWEFFGHVTSEEIGQANALFFNDPRSETSKYQIVHTLRTKSVEWKPVKMVDITFQDVAASLSGLQLKIAYIANQEEIRKKIEKYIEMSRHLNSNWQFRGFTDEIDARKWVNSNATD